MKLPPEEEGAGGSRDRSGPPAPFLRSPPQGDEAMNPCPVGEVTAVRFDAGRPLSTLPAPSAAGGSGDGAVAAPLGSVRADRGDGAPGEAPGARRLHAL